MSATLSDMWLDIRRDCEVITIPDGEPLTLHAGQKVYMMQTLGGMFSVEVENGQLVRIDGKDADAIGEDIPAECKVITKADLKNKTVKKIAWEQLQSCYDPEIPVNIVELGLIYNIKVLGENKDAIEVQMTLTAPGCGMGEVLKNDIEQKLGEIPGIKEVKVEIVFEPMWTLQRMSEAARLQLGLM